MTGTKRILILSKEYYPSNTPRAFRAAELAQEFGQQGHKVTVYVPFDGRDYKDYAAQHSLDFKDLGKLRFRDIGLTGGGVFLLFRRWIRRALLMLIEYPDIELMFKIKRKLKKERGYDLVISVAVPYPIHWGLAWARSKRQPIARTWVADCGDPYMGCKTDTFGKLFYFKFLEKWFCRKADYVTIPFEGAKDAYYKEFHPKIRIIPQGFSLSHIKMPEYQNKSAFPVFGYAGSFIPGIRDPRSFLTFLSTVEQEFKFIIFTQHDALIKPFLPELKKRLELRPVIPRKDLLPQLASMEFLVNFDNNTGVQYPSKLIDYALTGRPVLNITSTLDTSTIFQFLRGDYTNRMALKNKSHYDIKSVSRQFLELTQIS